MSMKLSYILFYVFWLALNSTSAGATDMRLENLLNNLYEIKPSSENINQRRGIFETIDEFLREDLRLPESKNSWQIVVNKAYGKAVDKIISDLKADKEDSLTIWKSYNMGYVIRTKNDGITIGIDLSFEWAPGKDISESQALRFAQQLDILLVTHEHGDHFSQNLLTAMEKLGKPVVSPECSTLSKYCKSSLKKLYGKELDLQIKNVQIKAFSGKQATSIHGDFILCNVYLVGFDGLLILHNGDNTDQKIYREIGKIDIALANCWSGYSEILARTCPRIIIPGHENELNHGDEGRKRFSGAYNWFESRKFPSPIVMAIGESLSSRLLIAK